MALHQLRNGETYKSTSSPPKRKFNDSGLTDSAAGKRRKTAEMGNKITLPLVETQQPDDEEGIQKAAHTVLPVRSRGKRSNGLEENIGSTTSQIEEKQVARKSQTPIEKASASVEVDSLRIREGSQKGRHTRFGSQEPLPLSIGQNDEKEKASLDAQDTRRNGEEEDSSGDDAPEAVTLAAGQEAVVILNKGSSQAIHRYAFCHISNPRY